MKTKLQKWGNSLGVRIPKNIIDQKSLQAGAGVLVVIKNDQIIIEPVANEMSLDSLLAGVSVDNIHQETEWSDVPGNEIW